MADTTPGRIAQIKGRVLKDLIASSKEEKKGFTKIGEEVKSYGHMADEQSILKDMGVEADLWFKITVAMTAQAQDLMCPYLYPSNPYRTGTVRKRDFQDQQSQQIAKVRNTLMMEYLNLTPDECDLYGESVRAINQSQVYGAGVLWTGLDERKGLVHSVYGDINELEVDPDVISVDRANWTARRRETPRWKLADEIPEAKNLIWSLVPNKQSKSAPGKTNDLITYYEVWMRVGLYRYVDGGLPAVDENGQAVTPSDRPMKYLVTEDGKLLKETTWEAPLFLDNLWPFEMVSYIEDEDCVWPISPMRAGLPFQRALNWLFIFYMTKIRFCSRSMFAIMNYGGTEIGTDNLPKLEMLNDLPFLNVRCDNENLKIGDLFQQLNLDPGLENFERAHSIIKREFQEHTGLYDILHYGEGETQDRSATATNFKDKTSKTRINYRQDRVKKWQSKVARKEALIARFIHTPEQIDVILGSGSGQLWGALMPPAEAAGNPMVVSFEQWFMETDYSIDSDSMIRHDHQTKVDSLKEAMNTVVPVQIQSIDLNEKAVAYDTIAEYLEEIGCADDIVQKQRDLANYFRQQAMMQAQMAQQMTAATQQDADAAKQQAAQSQQQVVDSLASQQMQSQAIGVVAQQLMAVNKTVSDSAKVSVAALGAATTASAVAHEANKPKKRTYKVVRGPDKLITGVHAADEGAK